MNNTSLFILKVHAVFLIILPIVLTIAGFAGMYKSMGPFTWLRDVPMTMVELMQAYLLMALIGITMFLGAGEEKIWRWSIIAIAAHCIPLLTIFSLWNVITSGGYTGIANYSYFIHGTWIAVETISLAITARQRTSAKATVTPVH